jgi:cell division protein FtsN
MSKQVLQHQTAESSAVASVQPAPTPAKRYARSKLQTASDIGNEMAKIYRLAKSGEMDASIATKLTYILQSLARILADSELEARIEALEQRGSFH